MNRISIRAVVSVIALIAVAACGGGGGGTGTAPATSTSAVSTGVMVKGSVIVNGVRFEDTLANIAIDDTPKVAGDLQDGMVVQVLGTVSGDGVNGTAQRVEAQIEVRGTPTSVNATANPPSLIVLGQTVIADDQTVYSNLANFAAITTSTLIEVHGLRDASGQIRATRIEANTAQMGDSTVDEIRGVVSGRADNTDNIFNVGAQVVNASSANVFPTGATYANGSVIEVHCTRPCVNGNGEFVASRIEVESAEDSAFQPGSGQRFEAEGLISGFTGHPGDFAVAGIPVTTTSSTRFEGGIATDLANDIKVEAEGVWNGTRLVASKIEFKRSVIRLQGTVTALLGGGAFTLRIEGRDVRIETDSFTSGAATVGPDCVQVRGQRKAGGGVVVTAGEISLPGDCSNGDRPVIQAPVEAESPESTITLLGFVLDVSSPTDNQPYVDINDQPISRTAFFNAVTPASPGPPAVAGTLVKVIFNPGANTVRQVELED
jgi:Domain of unknown function (DUF5666)